MAMSSETYFNLSQASELCGVSLPTMRKAFREGKFPNATETTQGKRKSVSIPMSDLQDSGMLDRVKGNRSQGVKPSQSETMDIFTADKEELIKLKETVRQLEARLEEAKERQEETSYLLRSLSAQLETKEQQEKRRKFWQFGN